MPGPRQPLKLLEDKGAKHLSKKETAKREAEEVKAEPVKQVRAPDFLPTDLRDAFNWYSRQLVRMEIFFPHHRDTLAFYLMARQAWLKATVHAQAAISNGDEKEARAWVSVQDTYFRQCRNCAGDLGLTITSQCRLVLPQVREPEENPFEKLMREREEGQRRA